MSPLKPFNDVDGRLISAHRDASIHDNRLQAEGVVIGNDDMSSPFRFRHYGCPFPEDDPQQERTLLCLDGQTVVSTVVVSADDITKDLLDQVRSDLRSLPHPLYEIWHSDHPLTSPPHVPDRWGSTTSLLARLRERVPVVAPPHNHDKVSSRREDRFGRNHMHVDSFFGMRTDDSGQRATFDRYFFNLGNRSRDILVAALSPACVGALLPDEYVPDSGQGTTQFLDPLLEAAGWSVALVGFATPPIDWREKRIYGLKIRVTHALHGEFGAKDDLLGVLTTVPSGSYENRPRAANMPLLTD